MWFLAAAMLVSLPISWVRFGPTLPTWATLAFTVQFAVLAELLRRDRQELVVGLWVTSVVTTLPLVIAAFGGPAGTAGPFAVTSAVLCVVWLEPRPALLAVAAHLGAIAASVPLTAALRGSPFEVEPGWLPSAYRVAMPLSVAFLVSVVGPLVHALRQTEAEAREHGLRSAEAARAARRAMDAKVRFLGTMSHELRTPLNAILGYTALLREDGGPGDSELARVESAGRQLLDLVEDLLELSRAEAVAPAPDQPVDLRALLEGLGAETRAVGDPKVASDPRRVDRLLRSVLGSTPPPVDLVDDADGVAMSFAPRLRGAPVEQLLAEQFASTLGGRLHVEGGRATLHLPRRRSGGAA
jgi:signal transduction histidine kinase